MKTGFTLIEVLIATAVAAIMGTVILMTYNQMNRSTQSIDNLIGVHERAALFMQQFCRDIQGAFIPGQEDEKKKESQGQKSEKKITHIFYSKNKDKQLDLLTFITNNPLQVYWSERAGKAIPRIARVVYRLKEAPMKKRSKNKSFILMRQEGLVLDFQEYATDNAQAPRAYELIDGIKELTISFGTYIEKEAGSNKKEKNAKKKSELEYQTLQEWDRENAEKNSPEESDQKGRAVPHEVLVTFSLWDAQLTKTTTFSFVCTIESDLEAAIKEKDAAQQEGAEKKEPAKKEELFSKSSIQKMLSQTEQMMADLKKMSVA